MLFVEVYDVKQGWECMFVIEIEQASVSLKNFEVFHIGVNPH